MVTMRERGTSSTQERIVDPIVAWLRERLDESGAKRFILGLSGGIDSAVVCGLCAQAAGPERVLGVIMPSRSNPDDAECAALVADTFRIPTVTVDLTSVSDALYGVMPDASRLTAAFGEGQGELWRDAEQLATANVRPRLRMTTLYYLANLCGGIVVGTGNKSEAAVGYYTKYGDGGVDLLPIIDLYKFEVREVAEVLGVPHRVIERPPSAGLWQGQTDEEELGLTYRQLDETLLAIERGDTSPVDEELLERVRRMASASEHKRRPIPSYRRNETAI